MSKTAREIISDTEIEVAEGKWSTLECVKQDVGDTNADLLIANLDAAGFIIVQKEPTEDDMRRAWPGYAPNSVSCVVAYKDYCSMIRYLSQEQKP